LESGLFVVDYALASRGGPIRPARGGVL